MEFQDKVLKCIDCGTDFIFTAGEQLFFHDKQFKNEPKRCKACKGKRLAVVGAPPAPGQNYRYTKVETQATCSGCGKQTPCRSRLRDVRCFAGNASNRGELQLQHSWRSRYCVVAA
jgi:DNA-directed RNA polymerase subunit RPC12/RpoP